jgi:hypothetical protein
MPRSGFYSPGDFGLPFNPYATPTNPFAVPSNWGQSVNPYQYQNPNLYLPNGMTLNGNPYSGGRPMPNSFYGPGTNPYGMISPYAAPGVYQMSNPMYNPYGTMSPYGTMMPYGTMSPNGNPYTYSTPYPNSMGMDPFTLLQMQNMQMQNSYMNQPAVYMGPYPMNNYNQMQLGGMNAWGAGQTGPNGMYNNGMGLVAANVNSSGDSTPIGNFFAGSSPFGGTGGGLFGPAPAPAANP